jgi:hypothetical protein
VDEAKSEKGTGGRHVAASASTIAIATPATSTATRAPLAG